MVSPKLRENKQNIDWNFETVQSCLTVHSIQDNPIEIQFPLAGECYYSDNIWNFNEFNKENKPTKDFIINFHDIDAKYLFYVKKFALKELALNRNTVISTKLKVNLIRKFLKFLQDENVEYFEVISPSLLKKFIHKAKTQEKVITKKKTIIKDFLQFMDSSVKNYIPDTFEYLCDVNHAQIKAEFENGKHKLIPYDATENSVSMFDLIVSLALKDLLNTKLSKSYRCRACMIVILCETGMRIGEFRILQENKLVEIKNPHATDSKSECKDRYYFLNFFTYKTTISDGYWTYTFMTPNAVIAYNTLCALTESQRIKKKTPYIFLTPNGNLYSDGGQLWFINKKFYSQHKDELDIKNKPLSIQNQFHIWTVTESDIKGRKIQKRFLGDEIPYPTPHQYRVTCATILYCRENKKLDWIRRHMNHLSEEMTEHYIRENAHKKRQIGIAKALVYRSNEEGTLLETDISKQPNKALQYELKNDNFKKIYKEINNFLDKISSGRKKLNLKKDVQEIVDLFFNNEIPIAEFNLGFCSLDTLETLCERQYELELYEDLEVQIPAIELLHISYKRFLDKITVIEYNKKLFDTTGEYGDSYNREINSMKNFIKRRFEPELILLENTLNTNSLDYVIKNAPHLEEIINNLTKIKKEISKWKTKAEI